MNYGVVERRNAPPKEMSDAKRCLPRVCERLSLSLAYDHPEFGMK